MSNKKQTTEEFDQWAAWNQTTYQTGSTQPPKHHEGIIAFLLGLVIFLCGISTALGMMNIRLFRELNAQPDPAQAPLAFAHDELATTEADPEAIRFPLGFFGQTVPEFWCLYQEIPHGVYVMHVVPGSDAALKGLSAGDVVIAVDGTTVTDAEQLSNLLQIYGNGQQIGITACRSGQHVDLKIEKETL